MGTWESAGDTGAILSFTVFLIRLFGDQTQSAMSPKPEPLSPDPSLNQSHLPVVQIEGSSSTPPLSGPKLPEYLPRGSFPPITDSELKITFVSTPPSLGEGRQKVLEMGCEAVAQALWE